MLQFVLETGLKLDDDLRNSIARVDRQLDAAGEATISDVPRALLASSAPAPAAGLTPDLLAVLLDIHGRLAALIVPATVVSLRYTAPRKFKWIHFLHHMPWVVNFAIVAAFVCMLGFIWTLPKIRSKSNNDAPPAQTPDSGAVAKEAPAAPPPAKSPEPQPDPGWWQSFVNLVKMVASNRHAWNSLFGAGLGAAFYILLRTQHYLADRSYDPKYNAVYIARFATGIVSGFILASVIGFVLWKGGAIDQDASWKHLTPGIVGLLGGFSAEAVEQILQRMVDVLVTVVRGDGSAQAQADQQAALASLSEEQTKANSVLRLKLADLKNVAADPAKVAQAVDALSSSLK